MDKCFSSLQRSKTSNVYSLNWGWQHIYIAHCYHNLQPFCLLLQSTSFMPSKDREAHHHCSSSKPVKKSDTSLVLVMAWWKQLIFSTAALNWHKYIPSAKIMQWLQTTWENHWLERNLFIFVSKLWIQSEHLCPAGLCWRNYLRKEKSQYELPTTYWIKWIKKEYGSRENSEFENNLHRQWNPQFS